MNFRPIHFSVLGWTALGVALGVGGWWTLQAFHLLPTVVVSLQNAGWSGVIQATRPGWIWWLLACQQTPPCQSALISTWLDLLHPWRFLFPGLLLLTASTLRLAADRAARSSHRQPGAARWSLPREVAPAAVRA